MGESSNSSLDGFKTDETLKKDENEQNQQQQEENTEPWFFEDKTGSLSLAGRDLESIPSNIVNFASNTKTLDLSFNSLTTLNHITEFKSLDSLILDNNELKDGLIFPTAPNLKTLSLNNNKITDIEPLVASIKTSFPSVQFLSMLKNPACPNSLVGGDEDDYKRYRLRVVHLLPQLKFLDSSPVTAAEKKEAVRVGAFLKVAKNAIVEQKPEAPAEKSSEEILEYRALPDTLANHGEHRGTFGVCKYEYHGKHSEGNRFIRNNDL